MKLVLIAALASAGALVRYGVGLYAPGLFAGLSAGTLIVNFVGCFAVGALFAVNPGSSHPYYDAVVVGFLGALTTFSSFSLDMLKMMQNGTVGLALGYAAIKVLGGLLLCYSGYKIFSMF